MYTDRLRKVIDSLPLFEGRRMCTAYVCSTAAIWQANSLARAVIYHDIVPSCGVVVWVSYYIVALSLSMERCMVPAWRHAV